MGVGVYGYPHAGLLCRFGIDVVQVQARGGGVHFQGRAAGSGGLDHGVEVHGALLSLAQDAARRMADDVDVGAGDGVQHAPGDLLPVLALRGVERGYDQVEAGQDPDEADFGRLLALLKGLKVDELRQALAQAAWRIGLERFVTRLCAPLTRRVGEAWARGDIEIYEEHLYTEAVQGVLRSAVAGLAAPAGGPRVLLATFPLEVHGLGLLMVEALLVPEGVQCISLGPQTPLEDIRRAAIAHKVHILALSFSGAFPLRQAVDGLATLRRQLPPQVTMWAGGEMTRRVRKTMPGIVLIPDLASTVNALRSWRSHWVPQAVGY